MNREEKAAYEKVRQRIVNELDRLESLKNPGSALKRWRRFGAAFAWDPSVYSDILAQPDMSDEKLLAALRSKEDTFMRRWGYIKKIPLHHEIASRTGGDLGIRTPVDVWLETKERIFDATGARPGNGQANLNATGAFDELWHLGREGAKGSVFEGTGIITPKNFPYLHRAGQNLAEKLGKDPKMVQATAAEQANALIAPIVQQQQRFKEVTATPQVQRQRQVFTDLGYSEIVDPTSTMEEMVAIRKATEKTPIPSIFAQAASIRFDPKASMQKFLQSAEGQTWFSEEKARRAAQGKPFNPYNLYGGVPYAQQMYETVRRNPAGALTGVGLDVLTDQPTQEAILKGDVGTAGTRLGTSAVIGSAVGSALKAAPAVVSRVASPVAAVTTGAALFQQGKPGSFTEKVINKAATVVPGLKPNPKTDIGKAALNELKYMFGTIKYGGIPYTR